MPNLKSSIKALRQSKKRADRNKIVRDELHSLRRHLRQALAGSDAAEVKKLVQTLVQKFDKAAKKNIIKKPTASRLKSRMMKSVNKLAGKK